MRKRILILIAALLAGGFALHLYVHRGGGGHGVLESLRKSVHGE